MRGVKLTKLRTGLEPVHFLHLLQSAFGHGETDLALLAAGDVPGQIDYQEILDLDDGDRGVADRYRLVVNEDDGEHRRRGRCEPVLDGLIGPELRVVGRGEHHGFSLAAFRGKRLADADVLREVEGRGIGHTARGDGGFGEGEGGGEEQEHVKNSKTGENVTALCYHVFGFISSIHA